MSRLPGVVTYIQDATLFIIGVGITIGQTGFPQLVEMPEKGPNVWALLTGALFCNGPVILQALALRFGGNTSSSAQPPDPLPLVPPSASSSVQSSGSDA